MSAKSTAHARWSGGLVDGRGTVTTDSPALDSADVTWRARIGDEAGTTPEELLASAHAACFAMALSGALAKSGTAPEQLQVDATCTFGAEGDGFAVQGVRLRLEATVPGMDEATLREHAEGAKAGCPISAALAGNVPIELEVAVLA